MKNWAYYSSIKISPYEALYGYKIKIGPNTSNLPHNIINIINCKGQLAELTTKQTQDSNLNVDNEELMRRKKRSVTRK